jgi:hypothetical protein
MAQVRPRTGQGRPEPARGGGSVVDIGISESVRPDWLLVVTIGPETFELALPDERGDITCERGRVDERNGSRFVTITRSVDGRDFERLSDCADGSKKHSTMSSCSELRRPRRSAFRPS